MQRQNDILHFQRIRWIESESANLALEFEDQMKTNILRHLREDNGEGGSEIIAKKRMSIVSLPCLLVDPGIQD